MADKDGGSILLRQDAAHGCGIRLERHERILYRSRVETRGLQMCDYIEPRGSVGVKAVHEDDVLGLSHVLGLGHILRPSELRCHRRHRSRGGHYIECSTTNHETLLRANWCD